jgi:hypothetical protein
MRLPSLHQEQEYETTYHKSYLTPEKYQPTPERQTKPKLPQHYQQRRHIRTEPYQDIDNPEQRENELRAFEDLKIG